MESCHRSPPFRFRLRGGGTYGFGNPADSRTRHCAPARVTKILASALRLYFLSSANAAGAGVRGRSGTRDPRQRVAGARRCGRGVLLAIAAGTRRGVQLSDRSDRGCGKADRSQGVGREAESFDRRPRSPSRQPPAARRVLGDRRLPGAAGVQLHQRDGIWSTRGAVVRSSLAGGRNASTVGAGAWMAFQAEGAIY